MPPFTQVFLPIDLLTQTHLVLCYESSHFSVKANRKWTQHIFALHCHFQTSILHFVDFDVHATGLPLPVHIICLLPSADRIISNWVGHQYHHWPNSSFILSTSMICVCSTLDTDSHGQFSRFTINQNYSTSLASASPYYCPAVPPKLPQPVFHCSCFIFFLPPSLLM